MVSKETETLVIKTFGAEHAPAIIRELDEYGSCSTHREVDRVHRTILSVAKGDVLRIPKLVKAAINDYRDVLIADPESHRVTQIDRNAVVIIALAFLCLLVLLFN